MATVAVVKERSPGETRVALVPESISRLTRAGVHIRVEAGAGEGAYIADEAFAGAGATIFSSRADLVDGADVVVTVRRPSIDEIADLPTGITLIGLLQPGSDEAFESAVRDRGIHALSLERVPRITRAQSMDVLSSQSTVSGYKAVLIGAAAMTKFLPMLTTAAGAIPPARAFVIGAGVAGLQAIATARRLGAVVSGFDIRSAAAEQVKSLGASFVEMELDADSETAGGYAKEQSADARERTLKTIAGHIGDMDLVISTAQIPGRPAPILITREMVASMRPGSVIVDLAAETGGNCELTVLGEEVAYDGVRIIGPANLSSTLPLHASQMFSRNVLTLLQHIIREGALVIDREDEIVGPMLLTPNLAAAN